MQAAEIQPGDRFLRRDHQWTAVSVRRWANLAGEPLVIVEVAWPRGHELALHPDEPVTAVQ